MRESTKKSIEKYFDLSCHDQLKRILAGLQKYEIDSFFYSTFKQRQRTSLIGSNIPWLKHLHDSCKNFKRTFENTFHFKSGFSITLLDYFLRQKNPDQPISMRDYEMRSGIYLASVSPNNDFSEVFYFLSSNETHTANKNLFEGSDKLVEFTYHFKEQAKTIIERATLSDEDIKSSSQITNANSVSNPPDEFKIKRYYLDYPYNKIYLTKKQLFYIKELVIGKAHKEIAEECDISYRTVEKHLELIKKKFEGKKWSEIIKIVLHSRLGYLIFNSAKLST